MKDILNKLLEQKSQLQKLVEKAQSLVLLPNNNERLAVLRYLNLDIARSELSKVNMLIEDISESRLNKKIAETENFVEKFTLR